MVESGAFSRLSGVGQCSRALLGGPVGITTENASIGFPVPIGGTPANLAISIDGQILCALLPGSTTGSVARFNMLTQQTDLTVSGFQATGYNTCLRDNAAQPGAEGRVAIDEGEYRRLKQKGFEHMATAISKQAEPAHSLFPGGSHHIIEPKAVSARHPSQGGAKPSPALCRRIQIQAQPPQHGTGLDGSPAARMYQCTNHHL
ncbi:MAG: hypothetical protein ABSD13_18420 [Candidatus Korobacteraceae bacterium]